MDQWIELRRKIRNREVSLRQLERDTGIGRQTLRKIRGQQSAAGLPPSVLQDESIYVALLSIRQILPPTVHSYPEGIMPNERKSTVLLEHHLKQLKLPTMLKAYPLLAKSCSQEKCDYPTYLLRLCEKEVVDRQRRAMDRRIQAAKFGLLKTIDSFDFASQKSVNEPLVRELLRCEFIDNNENVFADRQQRNRQDASGNGIRFCRMLSGL